MSGLAVYHILIFLRSISGVELPARSVRGVAGFSRIVLLPIVGLAEGGGRWPALGP